MTLHTLFRRAFGLGLFCLAGWAASGQIVELGAVGKGTALVADPAASGGKAVLLKLAEEGQGPAGRWSLTAAPAKPGLYRVETSMRLRIPADFFHGRLLLKVVIRGGGQILAERHLSGITLDPGGYARISLPVTLQNAGPLELLVSSEITETALGKPKKPVQPFKAPVAGALDASAAGKAGAEGAGIDDLMADMASEKAVSLESVDYPVLLLDRCEVRPLADTLAVDRVRPARIHVYPGESNAIAVTVRNYGATPMQGTVRLSMKTGLDEVAVIGEQEVSVAPGRTAESLFSWVSGAREFGHEALAEIVVGGKTVHEASEYFTVSAPLWKTAIQGPGFITWFGREKDFPAHVAANRRGYVNVEEAFSWQPSSWTDLNPTNDSWWTGQNNFHNSLSGLKEWMALSHAEGIKLITYMWSTASGPQGAEWARKYPDLVALSESGLCSEFYDVEDLRLSDRLHNDPAFEDYQYGVWHSFIVNLGRLRLIEMGASQLIQSAKNFGWDGVRFDCSLRWSAMGTDDVQAELREMGADELMRKLAPELMGITGTVWSGEAVSIRNVRYMKHRLREGIGPHFEIASNYGTVGGKPAKEGAEDPLEYFRNYCRGGSQVNQEYFRQSRSWKAFAEGLLDQVEQTRLAGGYHAVQSIDVAAPPWSHTYNNIFIFASGSHPYIYSEGKGSPGRYARFMTRYGEFLWDPALAPVTPEQAGISVKTDATLSWKPYVKQVALPKGTRTVVQLITPPGSDDVEPARPPALAPWAKNIRISKTGTVEPEVWWLSGEPDCRAVRLPVEKDTGGYAVVVPEHRLWSVIVWQEETP